MRVQPNNSMQRTVLRAAADAGRSAPSMERRAVVLAMLLSAIAIAVPARARQIRGTLGFTVEVEADGSFWKPILLSVRVTRVHPGSPAEASGLQASDEITEVQGKRIPGANAREIAALLEVRPGQSLHLQVRRAGGAVQSLVIVAGTPREAPD